MPPLNCGPDLHSIAIVLTLSGALLACEAPSQSSKSRVDAEVPAGTQVLTMDPEREQPVSEEDEFLLPLVHRLREASKVWSIGQEEGPPFAEWGDIVDIATDSQGGIYALDRLNVEVRIFSPEGRYLGSILRDGDGPLEMRGPTGIEWIYPDTLLVYSSSQARFLSKHVGDFRYEKGFVSSVGISGICSVGGRIHLRIASPRLEGTVRSVDSDGTELLVFGEMIHHDQLGVRAQLSMGGISCGEGQGGWVITSFAEKPQLHGYDLSGEQNWVAQLTEFLEPNLEVISVSGSPGISRPRDEPSDRVLSLVSILNSAVLLQVARIEAAVEQRGRRRRRIKQIDSFVLSSLSGAGRYVGSRLPKVLHATDSLLFAVEADAERGFLQLTSMRW